MTFMFVVILSVSALLLLLSVRKKQSSNHMAKFTVAATSPCFSVGFASERRNGLGNHLFSYAGVMYAAWLTGRKPFVLSSSKRTALDRAFDLDIERRDNNTRCPWTEFSNHVVYAYNADVKFLVNVDADVTVWLSGHFCSWKYTQPIEDQLRRKLRFRRELTKVTCTCILIGSLISITPSHSCLLCLQCMSGVVY